MTADTQVGSGRHAAEPKDGVLRNRDFTKLWTGETVSLAGAQVTELALPLTAIVTLNATAFQIGVLNVARYAPWVLIALFVGVWFDRRRRRPALIASNIGRALIIGMVPLAGVLGFLSIELLYVVGCLAGILTVVFDVGLPSYVPGLVERRHLAEANSKIQISFSLAGIGGPGLAGSLVGLLTAPLALAVVPVTYLMSALAMASIRKREPEPEPPADRPSVLGSIAEGLRAVVSNRILRHLATQSATFNLFENVVVTIFVVYAVRELGLTPAQLGIVIGAGSVGALTGAMLSNRIRAKFGFGRTMRYSTLAACLSTLLLLAPGGSGVVALVVLGGALAVHGFNLAIFNVNALTLRQSVTEDRLLGRMNASYRLILFGTVPLGALLGGSLAGAFGLRLALVIGVIGVAAPILWIPFSPVFKLRDIPEPPKPEGEESAAKPAPEPHWTEITQPLPIWTEITQPLPIWTEVTQPLPIIQPADSRTH